jgi:hypothetical protein
MITRNVHIPFVPGEIPAPAPSNEDETFKHAWVERILLILSEDGGIVHILRKSTLQTDPDTGYLKAQTLFEDTVLLNPEIDYFLERIVVGVPLFVMDRATGEKKALIRWFLAPTGATDVVITNEDEHGIDIESHQHNLEDFDILAEDVLYSSGRKMAQPHRKKKRQNRPQTAQKKEEH